MLLAAKRWNGLGTVILGLGLAFLFLYTMAPFVVALVLGAVIALLCEPLYNRLRDHRVPRLLAGVSIVFSVTLLILAPLSFVVLNVAFRLAAILREIKIPDLAELSRFTQNPVLLDWLHKLPPWIPVDRNWLQEQGLSLAQKIVEKLSQITGLFLSQIPGLLLGFAIVIIAAYFFIVDGKRFVAYLASISPLSPQKSRELFDAFASSCRGVVLGMLAASLTQGFLIALFFGITSVPNALFWGLAGVIMGMVPVIGVAPVLFGGLIYHFVDGNWIASLTLLCGAALIASADNVVRSYVLKGHGEMHPLLGLVSAFGAVTMLGPTGIILGPIIAAVFVAFLAMLPGVESETVLVEVE